jgi:hypothetical protein
MGLTAVGDKQSLPMDLRTACDVPGCAPGLFLSGVKQKTMRVS